MIVAPLLTSIAQNVKNTNAPPGGGRGEKYVYYQYDRDDNEISSTYHSIYKKPMAVRLASMIE